ncbi:MAG: hypothetical protein NC311_14460 [Muribaculaceae bacterium]|nr:hypothetical protein [Muribaculaceae bacterium]
MKTKFILGVVIEIVVMAVEIGCCILPMPWRLVVPIIIGARAIIIKARKYAQEHPLDTLPKSTKTTSSNKAKTAKKKQ